ncbi:MAG: hypothetical protein ACOY90_20555 [Candidatus Zhuqueibacterota bacterium]
MAKNCTLCGSRLSFRNSFVWQNKRVCKSCLKQLEKNENIDFLTIYPKAVLVLSTLPSKELTDDWFVKFLAIAVGSKLGHKDINHSLDLITKFEKSGMVSGICGDVKDQELTDATFCEQQVNRAFPNVVDGPHRLRLAQIDDALHLKVNTTIAWIFPPDESKINDVNSLRFCTHKHHQIKLIDSKLKNYPYCSERDSCSMKCIYNLADNFFLVGSIFQDVDSDLMKQFVLKDGAKDYTTKI